MFIRNARKGSNSIVDFFISVLVIIVLYMLTSFIGVGIMFFNNGNMANINMEDLMAYTPVGYAAMLGTFIGLLVGPPLVIKWFHKRHWMSVVSAFNRFRWKHFFIGLLFWLVVTLALEGVNYVSNPDNYVFNFKASQFFPLLFISLIMLFIQTGAEEIFIRGYLLQQFSHIGNSRLVAIILSSLVFAALHGMNPEIGQYGLMKMMSYYMMFGVLLAVITLMDDGIEIAWGMHYMNNFISAVFLGYQGSALNTPTMFMSKSADMSWTTIVVFLVVAVLTFLFLKRFLRWGGLEKVVGPSVNNIHTNDLYDEKMFS